MTKGFSILRLLSLAIVASGAGATAAVAADATPNFAPTTQSAWVGIGIGALLPVPGSPKPVGQDPAYPYIPNGTPGKQPTQRVSDISNPNLMQWAKDAMKKDNEEVLRGKFAYTARAACTAAGVPGFDVLLGGALQILQSPREVTMIFSGNSETRHIALDVPHAANPKPSFYGDSVGHYEGDTLVVDTIGLVTRTFADFFFTPHTDKLHVVERFEVLPGGKTMDARIRVEDSGAFTGPWEAVQHYRRVEPGVAENETPLSPISGSTAAGPLIERICAENAHNYFGGGIAPIPQATKADF